MKKRILFIVINMNVGGTERALLNMLHEMNRNNYDITLLMLEKYGGFLQEVPDDVTKKYLHQYRDVKHVLNKPPQEVIKQALKKFRFIEVFILLFLFTLAKVFHYHDWLFRYVMRNVPMEEKVYDTAIAYAGPMNFISYFLVYKVKAVKKVQWIHFDLEHIGFEKQFVRKLYAKIDSIIAVSNRAKQSLTAKLPELEEKVTVFPNYLSKKVLQQKAFLDEGFQDQFNGLRILTVGRLEKEKGHDIAILTCKKLIDNGFHIRWYAIGEGSAREMYEKQISEYKLEDSFFLLGEKENPYPFIKACDIYVQTSRHEGFCLSVNEAKIFHRPIVTTSTAASELIRHGKTGIIVDCSSDSVYEAVKYLIERPDVRKRLTMNLHKEQTENSARKIDRILQPFEKQNVYTKGKKRISDGLKREMKKVQRCE